MDKSLPESLECRIRRTPTCWLWVGAHTSKGYSEVWWDGKVQYAHRVIFGLLHGPIPPRLIMDHLCRNRGCVNPSHVEHVTNAENIARGRWKGTGPRQYCKGGHDLYNPINTTARGRRCRICKNLRDRLRRRRLREK